MIETHVLVASVLSPGFTLPPKAAGVARASGACGSALGVPPMSDANMVSGLACYNAAIPGLAHTRAGKAANLFTARSLTLVNLHDVDMAHTPMDSASAGKGG